MIDFWATWCPYCVEERADIVNTYNAYKDEGFEVIGVSRDVDPNQMAAFTRQYKMPWRQIFDGEDKPATTLYSPDGMPMPYTIVVGRDGKIAAFGVRKTDLTRAIKKAMMAETVEPAVVEESLPQATEINR